VKFDAAFDPILRQSADATGRQVREWRPIRQHQLGAGLG